MLFTPRFSFDGQPRPDHANDSATDPGDQGLPARGIRRGARLGSAPSRDNEAAIGGRRTEEYPRDTPAEIAGRAALLLGRCVLLSALAWGQQHPPRSGPKARTVKPPKLAYKLPPCANNKRQ